MRFVRAFLNSVVELLAGMVLIGGGVYVSSVGSSDAQHRTGLLIAGGVLTTLGGVLLSWIASRAFTREQARTDFARQLGNVSRNLGQAAGQISRAVEQALARDIHSNTGFALISQANRMIYGQVNEISVIQGAEFDAAYLLKTVAKLDELALQLEGNSRGGESLAQVRRELENLRTSLSRGQAQRTYSSAQVTCPTCSAPNAIELGDFLGDTATGECTRCHARYNAHRAADGTAFSRPVGPSQQSRAVRESTTNQAAPASKRWHFACPSCGKAMSARGDEVPKSMVCTQCYAGLLVDTLTRSVVEDGKYDHTLAPIAGRSGYRPLLACPTCGTLRNALLNTGSSYFAFCIEHRQLMEVTRDDWERWQTHGLSPDSAAPPQADGKQAQRLASSSASAESLPTGSDEPHDQGGASGS